MEMFLIIAVCSLITFGIRLIPFVLLRGREIPGFISYLGRYLPPAIMAVLIIYCLRSVSFTESPYGVPELLCAALCALLQIRMKNTILSIAAATAAYMLLIRLL